MIASSQFSNLQLDNLATRQLGNLATYQEMLNSLSTLATFNFCNFHFWQLSILATFKKSKRKITLYTLELISRKNSQFLQLWLMIPHFQLVWILRSKITITISC